jgi:hypothetical protein
VHEHHRHRQGQRLGRTCCVRNGNLLCIETRGHASLAAGWSRVSPGAASTDVEMRIWRRRRVILGATSFKK